MRLSKGQNTPPKNYSLLTSLKNMDECCVRMEELSVSDTVSQSVSQSASDTVSQSVSQPASDTVSHSVSQSASDTVSQSVSQSASDTVSQSVSQSASDTVSQSVSQSASDTVSSWTINLDAKRSYYKYSFSFYQLLYSFAVTTRETESVSKNDVYWISFLEENKDEISFEKGLYLSCFDNKCAEDFDKKILRDVRNIKKKLE
jgi:hypothetical protein